MPQCPYPEKIIDIGSGKIEQNGLYKAWHEGFEAHKLEIANKVKTLDSLGKVLDTQVKQVTDLQSELATLKEELQKKIGKYI